jgi:TPP-dependent pyruvate/acetoin dehydrogenase alpha subunit
VFCFVGDMTSETGSFEECYKYVRNFDLPVKFIIEDNGRSILTDTKVVWNMSALTREGQENEHLHYYKYENKWPHAGAGQRVKF